MRSRTLSLSMIAIGSASLFVAVLLLAGPGVTRAAETPSVIAVPSAKGVLHLAVSVPADALPGGRLQWIEVDHPEIVVPAQRTAATAPDATVAEGKPCVAASVPPRDGASGLRRFQIEAVTTPVLGGFSFREIDDQSTELADEGQPVLVYNHGVVTDPKVPKDDPRRNRACFVHPVYGVSGEVLTESFPKDHYHHHGIFWAWPHILIDGKEHDLWVDSNIRQRFVRWICREAGPVTAVLAVENGWFVGDKKVMIERAWLRAYKPADGARAIDLELTLIPVDKPITLRGAEGKSYGGLNMRFAARKDTVITVPSGRTKEDLPDTRLAWADLTAQFAGSPGPSGAAIFADPKQAGFPPAWLTRHYGILCCGWPGVKSKTLPPGEPIRLDYRVWIHQSAVGLADLQRAFDGYGAVRQ